MANKVYVGVGVGSSKLPCCGPGREDRVPRKLHVPTIEAKIMS